jgi:hypothetical protein
MREDIDEYFLEFLGCSERVEILEYTRDEDDDLIFPDRLRLAHADRYANSQESLGKYLEGFIFFHDDGDILWLYS